MVNFVPHMILKCISRSLSGFTSHFAGTSLNILVNGISVDFSNSSERFQEFNSSTAERTSNGSMVLSFPSGISFEVKPLKGMLEITVSVPDSTKGQTRGLLGVWNNNTEDDFTLPDGMVLNPNSSERLLYAEFGQLCELIICAISSFVLSVHCKLKSTQFLVEFLKHALQVVMFFSNLLQEK